MTGPVDPNARLAPLSDLDRYSLERTLAAFEAERQRLVDRYDRRIADLRAALERGRSTASKSPESVVADQGSSHKAKSARPSRRREGPSPAGQTRSKKTTAKPTDQ